MLAWFAETTLVALALAALAALAGRSRRLGPAARHALWVVVLIKLVAPPLVTWPRSARPAWSARSAAPTPTTPVVAASVLPIPEPEFELDHDPSGPPAEIAWRVEAARPEPPWRLPDLTGLGRIVLAAWAIASLGLAIRQVARIARFGRRLRRAVPAPPWLDAEARRIGRRLGVRTPEVLVIPESTTPMLWFLGRPKLLLPARLVAGLGAEGWRGVLAHELAHIRRGDHWVRRLELVAGLLWWWNPLYWITRRRLEAEAELACDELAVRAFPAPAGRFAFAEALLEVCRSLAPARPAVPALGVVGAGRFLERRVTMILRDPTPTPARGNILALWGTSLLALLALPGWGLLGAPAPKHQSAEALAVAPVAAADDSLPDDDRVAVVDDEDDDRPAARRPTRDEDDGEDAKPAKAKDKEAAKDKAKAERDAARAKARGRQAEAKAERDAARAKALGGRAEEIAKEIEAKFGPGSDFQKEMEALGPKIAESMKGMEKEMTKKFGPGSDFEKEMTKKFGPGSDFEKRMKEKFGPDSEFAKKFGPGSEFDKEMQAKFGPDSKFAKEMEAKFGPGSDFEKRMKDVASRAEAKAKARADADRKKSAEARESARSARAKEKDKASDPEARGAKARRIRELQLQIERLNRQLKELQGDDDGEEDDDDDDDQ